MKNLKSKLFLLFVGAFTFLTISLTTESKAESLNGNWWVRCNYHPDGLIDSYYCDYQGWFHCQCPDYY